MIWLLLLACREPGLDSGTDSVAQDFCADVPVMRWTNFGEGYINGNCQGCHASTSPDRHKAPEGVTFDDVDQVWAQKDSILWVSTGDNPSMPPNGGVHDDDRVRLEWWLRCAPTGT